jgi:hypothetical protein
MLVVWRYASEASGLLLKTAVPIISNFNGQFDLQALEG